MRVAVVSMHVALACCVACVSGPVAPSTASPDLKRIARDVHVVANADAPVFFSDGCYWIYTDGLWFQSTTLDGRWEFAPPPNALRGLEQPFASAYPPARRVHVDISDRGAPREPLAAHAMHRATGWTLQRISAENRSALR